jgi:hypothetical protein
MRIEASMEKWFFIGVLMGGCLAAAQVAPPVAPEGAGPSTTKAEDLPPQRELTGKTSLIRGVLTRMDPIHDQLIVRAFGGSDVRIAFDTRTELAHEDTHSHLTSIPAGSVVSVDTVMDHGKLFARTVRVATSSAGDLSGQVVGYDAAKSRLTVRDPMSPENISLQVTPKTSVINRGQPSSTRALAPGMLVRVRFSPAQDTASNIEILAERGDTFTFAGRVVAVDLRMRSVALSNDSDHSVHELAIGSLDPASLRLLREGADVSIQAEFDGDRYKARAVSAASPNR